MTNNQESQGERLTRCQSAVEEQPDSASAHYNLGLAYIQAGRMTSAAAAYRKSLELDPDRPEAWVNLAGALLLMWDFKGSKEANLKALELEPDGLVAHYNLGQACLYLKEPEEVVRCNQRVVELDPNHAAGHYHLAVGLLALGRTPEARQACGRAMSRGHRPSPDFLRELERAEKRLKQNDEADIQDPSGASAPE